MEVLVGWQLGLVTCCVCYAMLIDCCVDVAVCNRTAGAAAQAVVHMCKGSVMQEPQACGVALLKRLTRCSRAGQGWLARSAALLNMACLSLRRMLLVS